MATKALECKMRSRGTGDGGAQGQVAAAAMGGFLPSDTDFHNSSIGIRINPS